MAARPRKVSDKKLPAFRVTRVPEQDGEEQDLKKVKERIKKELEENEADKKEWLDKELDKNLKNIK